MFRRVRLLALLAVAPMVAFGGCGGTAASVAPPTASTPAALTAPAHPCNSSDFTLSCGLATVPAPLTTAPAPSHTFGLVPQGAHALFGADFAWGAPSPAAMRAAGAKFGWSYFSNDPSKNWHLATVNAYHAAGLATVGGWETTAARATEGFAAGYADARDQRLQARAVGKADSRPDLFAIDCDCSGPQVSGYFQGAQAGDRSITHLTVKVDAYGGYFPLVWLYQHGLVGHENFQTYAWSRGLWLPASIAPLEQFSNDHFIGGVQVDFDRAIAPDYGQWPFNARPAVNHHYPWFATGPYAAPKSWAKQHPNFAHRLYERHLVQLYDHLILHSWRNRFQLHIVRQELLFLRARISFLVHHHSLCIDVSSCAPDWRFHRHFRLFVLGHDTKGVQPTWR